jgi:hypothetical protein
LTIALPSFRILNVETQRRSEMNSTKRTRLGKVVGSYKQPMDRWYCYPVGTTWYVCAPSGARMTTHTNEQDARDEVARRNEEEA